ncbi:MAG: TFIIB-type zinc ribbon-containing protein [Thermoplasmatales archaeon]|nr:TFIIB-type zinc ribbon-containing protein [Thermoplasmatales archaeon]
MGKKLALSCPHCLSHRVVRNGHPHGDKLQFFCHSCDKYFSEDAAKGYPPTNIPYPVIAYLLYFRKRVPEFSNMREFRRFVSQWLNCLGIKKGEVSRQIIHHWIKNYEPDLERIISFEEARDYCRRILSRIVKDIPETVKKDKTIPHTHVLKIIEDIFGRDYSQDLIRRDRVFFDELCELVSKYNVYCYKSVDERLGRLAKRPFFARS